MRFQGLAINTHNDGIRSGLIWFEADVATKTNTVPKVLIALTNEGFMYKKDINTDIDDGGKKRLIAIKIRKEDQKVEFLFKNVSDPSKQSVIFLFTKHLIEGLGELSTQSEED